MRTISILSLAAALALSALGCAPPDDVALRRIASHRVSRTEGATVQSASGTLTIAFPPRVFVEDATVTITEVEGDAVPVDTIGPVYLVEASGEEAIVFEAELRFDLSDADVTDPAALEVAHGEALGEAPSEILPTTWDADAEEAVATTRSLSWFGVVDEPAAEPEPDPDPEPTGDCDASCMAQEGATCCTACGCQAEIRCLPSCPSGYDWDCELQCCFDYENTTCLAE